MLEQCIDIGKAR
jgi:DNA mismatch repair ATPase MutS